MKPTRTPSALSVSLFLLPIACLVVTLALRAQNRSPSGVLPFPRPAATTGTVAPLNYPSNSLWIHAEGSLSNHTLNGLVNGTTPGSPYFLLSRPSLSSTDAWSVEQLLIGAAGQRTPFSVPISNRSDTLFLSARPWSSNDEITAGLQIAITNPRTGAWFWSGPTNLSLAAGVQASNSVLGVAFYNQTGLLGWASSTPFSLAWEAPSGIHVLSARAFDSLGHSRASDPITNTVDSGSSPETPGGPAKPGDYRLFVQKSLGSCATAPSGLVGWWRGEGNADDTFHLYNGVLQGAASASATGEVGQALHFDGTNGCVVIQDSLVRFSSLDSPGVGAPVGKQYIVFRQNSHSNSTFEGFSLVKVRVSGQDVFKLLITSSGGSSVEVTSSTAISTNVWYHIAALRGSNYIQLYTNGQFAAQATINFPQDYGYWPLYFGSSGQTFYDRHLSGDLDEVSFYNRALSSNEIQVIYDAGTAPWTPLASTLRQIFFSPPAHILPAWLPTSSFSPTPQGSVKQPWSPTAFAR